MKVKYTWIPHTLDYHLKGKPTDPINDIIKEVEVLDIEDVYSIIGREYISDDDVEYYFKAYGNIDSVEDAIENNLMGEFLSAHMGMPDGNCLRYIEVIDDSVTLNDDDDDDDDDDRKNTHRKNTLWVQELEYINKTESKSKLIKLNRAELYVFTNNMISYFDIDTNGIEIHTLTKAKLIKFILNNKHKIDSSK